MYSENPSIMSQANRRYVVKASPDHILMSDWSFVHQAKPHIPGAPAAANHQKPLA